MTRIITPTQISIFAISQLAAELEELVILKGLSFGMDLSKYKLDKE